MDDSVYNGYLQSRHTVTVISSSQEIETAFISAILGFVAEIYTSTVDGVWILKEAAAAYTLLKVWILMGCFS